MSLGMRTLLSHTRRSLCNTLTVQALYLYKNQIGDAGVMALADACASGSLPKLKYLFVDDGALGKEHPVLQAACRARGIRLM